MPSKNKQKKKKERERRNRRTRNKSRGTKAQNRNESKLSPNAKIVLDYMRMKGIKGDFRDYVIFTGNRMIDYEDSYNVMFKDPNGFDGVSVVHKRILKNIIPEEYAEKFWHPKLGRVGAKK